MKVFSLNELSYDDIYRLGIIDPILLVVSEDQSDIGLLSRKDNQWVLFYKVWANLAKGWTDIVQKAIDMKFTDVYVFSDKQKAFDWMFNLSDTD